VHAQTVEVKSVRIECQPSSSRSTEKSLGISGMEVRVIRVADEWAWLSLNKIFIGLPSFHLGVTSSLGIWLSLISGLSFCPMRFLSLSRVTQWQDQDNNSK
jgi:hypothetical protein